MDPYERWNCEELLSKSACFLRASFQSKTLPEMQAKIEQESNNKQISLKQNTATSSSTSSKQGNSNEINSNNKKSNSVSRQSQHRSMCSITPFERSKMESSFSTYAEKVKSQPEDKKGEGYVVKEINLPKLNKHSNQTTSKKSTSIKKHTQTQKSKLNKSTSNKQSENNTNSNNEKLNKTDNNDNSSKPNQQHFPSLTMNTTRINVGK